MTSGTQTSTTFVQADRATFRHLVQQLTGLPGIDPDKVPPAELTPKLFPKTSNRRSPFKLQDRRRDLRNKPEIKLGLSGIDRHRHRHAPRKTDRAGSPGLSSPVTPLGSELALLWAMNLESPVVSEEEKVIAEKGFYFQPSPVNSPRGKEPPELLPLFPITSPEQEIS